MVIEWLKFKVAPTQRETFIQQDEAIWTAFLASQAGFAGKEVWLDPEQLDQVVVVVRWLDRDAWKSISAAQLEQTERQFAAQMGATAYSLIEAGEFQVRKFPRPQPQPRIG